VLFPEARCDVVARYICCHYVCFIHVHYSSSQRIEWVEEASAIQLQILKWVHGGQQGFGSGSSPTDDGVAGDPAAAVGRVRLPSAEHDLEFGHERRQHEDGNRGVVVRTAAVGGPVGEVVWMDAVACAGDADGDVVPGPEAVGGAGEADRELTGDGRGHVGPEVAELGNEAAGDGLPAVEPEADAAETREGTGGESGPEGGAVHPEKVGAVVAEGDIEGLDMGEEGEDGVSSAVTGGDWRSALDEEGVRGVLVGDGEARVPLERGERFLVSERGWLAEAT
jgi:hypothetical protein